MLYLIEILHQTTTIARILFTLFWLYLIEILHQTTTYRAVLLASQCCILSKFYIKPQLEAQANLANAQLYLIEILHQTTTS